MSETGVNISASEIQEPDFSEYGLSAEGMRMHRVWLVDRALEFGEDGWYRYAEEITRKTYQNYRTDGVIALTTLTYQGLVEPDMQNPQVLRVTELGKQWHTLKLAEHEARKQSQ
jgi:hypothetical protein